MKKVYFFAAVAAMLCASFGYAQGITDVSRSRDIARTTVAVSNATSTVSITGSDKQLIAVHFSFNATATATGEVAYVTSGGVTNLVLSDTITATKDSLNGLLATPVWLVSGDTIRITLTGPKNCDVTYTLAK